MIYDIQHPLDTLQTFFTNCWVVAVTCIHLPTLPLGASRTRGGHTTGSSSAHTAAWILKKNSLMEGDVLRQFFDSNLVMILKVEHCSSRWDVSRTLLECDLTLFQCMMSEQRLTPATV